MAEMIDKRVVLKVLEVIREEIWGVDIPSATVPEYVEHHRQMQALMKLVDKEKEHIKSLPDVMEVVRCKDCVFFENENPCGIVDWWNNPDDFCSKGKRRV